MLIKFTSFSFCAHYSCTCPFLILACKILWAHTFSPASPVHVQMISKMAVSVLPSNFIFSVPVSRNTSVMSTRVSQCSTSPFLSLSVTVSVIVGPVSLLRPISNLAVTLNSSMPFLPLASWSPNLDSTFLLLFFFLLWCFLNWFLFLGIQPHQINPLHVQFLSRVFWMANYPCSITLQTHVIDFRDSSVGKSTVQVSWSGVQIPRMHVTSDVVTYVYTPMARWEAKNDSESFHAIA